MASFQNLRFSSAPIQAAVRASSVSPTAYPAEEVLLQKLTVHHKTSCNRRWVVTRQAERPSARDGVREIFLSLSVPGWRTRDWQQTLLMRENRGKYPKNFPEVIGETTRKQFLGWIQRQRANKTNVHGNVEANVEQFQKGWKTKRKKYFLRHLNFH